MVPTSDPSEMHAIVPTRSPSYPQSNIPTREPSYTHTLLPSYVLGLLHPRIIRSSGFALPRFKYVSGSASATSALFNGTFGALFGNAVGTLGSFVLSVGYKSYDSTSISFSVGAGDVRWIRGVLKTPVLYVDSRNVKVVYQVRDEAGRSQVNTHDLVVSLVLTLDSYLISKASCGSPDSLSGIGMCSSIVDVGLFASPSTQVGELTLLAQSSRSTTVMAQSESISVVLNRVSTFISPSSTGMVLTLPQSPVIAGSSFTVTVWASTGTNSLTAWAITLYFSSSLFSYVGSVTGSLYVPAVVVSTDGKVTLSTSGLASGVSESFAVGDSVNTVSVTFMTRSGISAGTYENVMKLFVNNMVNVNSILFQSDVWAAVHDFRDSVSNVSYTSGSVMVTVPIVVGLVAYSPHNEIINTYTFTGIPLFSTIIVYAVYGASSDLVLVTDRSLCYSNDARVIDVVPGTCTVSLSSGQLAGSNATAVGIYYAEQSTNVSFRVWFPTGSYLSVEDGSLESISLQEGISCQWEVYQNSAIYLETILGGPGLPSISVYVTDLASYVASEGEVVVLSGSLVVGLHPGSTDISVISFGALLSGVLTTSITVGGSVTVISLDVVVVSSVSVVGAVSVLSSVNSYQSVNPTFMIGQRLSAEGQVGYVAAYVRYSDGTYSDVTRYVRLSSNTSSLVVMPSPSGPTVQVALGAKSISGYLLLGEWVVCGSKVVGKGFVDVSMPTAKSVTIRLSSGRVCANGDAASLSPFYVSTTSTVSVEVLYVDGSSKSFTSPSVDNRLHIAIINGGENAYVQSNVLYVNGSVGVHGRIRLLITFPGLYSVMGTVELTLVSFSAVSVYATPYPCLSDCFRQTSLRRIGCSDVFQRSSLVVSGMLTDNSTALLGGLAQCSSDNAAVALVREQLLLGVGPGVTRVSCIYASKRGDQMVEVLNEAANMTSVVIQSNLFVEQTLYGLIGLSTFLQVYVGFDDGTSYADIVSGVSSAWIAASLLLSFESSVQSAIAVNQSGAITLLGNYYAPIVITARSSCRNTQASGQIQLYANLAPDVLDVDLGHQYGAPFGVVGVGDTFSMPVRINAGAHDLTAFQITITFNSSILRVSSDSQCTQGSSWTSSWSCTTNDPIDRVLLVGSCGLLPASSCSTTGLLTVANIVFISRTSGVSLISGVIVKLQESSAGSVSDEKIRAGSDYLIVSRLVLGSALQPLEGEVYSPARISTGTRRSLAVCSSCVLGDTNGDCVFDVSDVVYLQYYIGGVRPAITSCQSAALDPDLNGMVNTVDVQYLVYTLTSKYRFVRARSVLNATGLLSLSTTVVDGGQSLCDRQVSVEYELRTNLNRQMGFLGGVSSVETLSGVSVQSDQIALGVYGVSGIPYAVERDVGIVSILTTYDALGESSSTRMFSFYCSPLLSACTSAYG